MENKVKYIDTSEAIKQRHVDKNSIALHEMLGICFGRKQDTFEPEFEKVKGHIERHL